MRPGLIQSRAMSTPRAVLIDLDGTLVDSAPELAAAVDRMLGDLGHRPAGLAKARDWVGGGINALVAHALADALQREPGDDERGDARARFDTYYAEILGTIGPLYPGVVTGLDRLREAGVATACITNKVRLFALPLLGALGIADRFDVLVAGDTASALKPDPAPLALAAERLGVAIGDCVMVGDSGVDVVAARAAGCAAWCVRTGYSGSEPIDAAGPDAVFDRLDELVEALLARGTAAAGAT